MPLGASAFWLWCSSIISTWSKCWEAWGSGLLQQHHADREIGNQQTARAGFFCKLSQFLHLGGTQTRSADHGPHAVGDRRSNVVVDRIGVGEVYHHAQLLLLGHHGQHWLEVVGDRNFQSFDSRQFPRIHALIGWTAIDGSHQGHIFSLGDRFNHFAPHFAGRTVDQNWDGEIRHNSHRLGD